MAMLPDDVVIWVKGKKFIGEIPDELCPPRFKGGALKPKVEKKEEKKKDK